MTTAERWAGKWGNDYTIRNLSALSLPRRGDFWRSLLAKHPAKSILEIGSGAGANLRHLEADRIVGVDVNENALRIVRLLPDVEAVKATATQIPLADDSFELVYTCGLLIHIPEHELGSVLDEMYRLSSRYLLTMEYHSAKTEEVEYRGERGLLWKRPYEIVVQQRFPELTLIDEGFLGHEDGFDDLVWSLFTK